MTLERMNAVLQGLKSFRSEDVPRLVKTLENLGQSLGKTKASEVSRCYGDEIFMQQVAECYCHSLVSPKLARSVDKLLRQLPSAVQLQLEKAMLEKFESFIEADSPKYLKTVCTLLDLNMALKKAAQRLVLPISRSVANTLSQTDFGREQYDETEHIHFAVKLSIQVLQLCASKIQESFTQQTGPVYDQWNRISLSLMSLLFQNPNRDLLLLTGTSLAMIFNLAPCIESKKKAFTDFIQVLSKESTCFSFCGFHFTPDSKTFPLDNALPLLSILKGLLVSCSKELLGKMRLLLFVFPYILLQCQGESTHHYIAFQIFSLWSQKLTQIETENIMVNIQTDFNHIFQEVMSTTKPFFSQGMSPQAEKDAPAQDNLLKGENAESCTGSLRIGKQSVCDKRSSPISEGEAYFLQENNKSIGEKEGPAFRHKEDEIALMSRSCPVLSLSLSCIWLNWDSPVDGVSEYVSDIFKNLLKVWHNCVMKESTDFPSLCQYLVDRVLGMACHVRARYRPLSLLLLYVDCTQLLRCKPQLQLDLLQCMVKNNMASTASDVYVTFLHRLRADHIEDMAEAWKNIWMPTVISGLMSQDSLQRLKVCTYWLPPSLKLIPSCDHLLLTNIEQGLKAQEVDQWGQWLFAWATVSRMARELQDVPLQTDAVPLLKQALFCDMEEIRAEALRLLSGTLKKAEPVTELEFNLLRISIPPNLKTDSAPFRQTLTSSLKKIFVRIRDSCISSVRTGRFEEPHLVQGLEFVHWLYQLLMLSLASGGAYQRRQTTFDILHALLGSIIYKEHDVSKKGQVPAIELSTRMVQNYTEFLDTTNNTTSSQTDDNSDASAALCAHAQGKGLWNFFSDKNVHILLLCLEDGSEEIQLQSYDILMRYVTWSGRAQDSFHLLCKSECNKDVNSKTVTHLDTAVHLLEKAFALTVSPRAYENHSGLLLMSLVLNKYILDLGIAFNIAFELEVKVSLRDSDIEKAGSGAGNIEAVDISFLNTLIMAVESSLTAVQSDLARNFKLHPIHGMTQCLSRCVQEMSSQQGSSPAWVNIIENMVNVNQDIINFVLELLAGGKAIEECPSFADMGIALENLISGSQAEQDEDITTLSPDFQLLLSWCWINLKESCSSLGLITATALTADFYPAKVQMLTVIGETFVKVLTSCRHRGAIEGCRSGFLQFCTSLMSSKSSDHSDIPKSILRKVLTGLSENSMTASVTRRSAGLPIIVQCVIQSANKYGDASLLLSTVEELYSIASEPVSDQHNQQHDLKQSHALNILKVIFCDASLSSLLRPLLCPVTILVIEGFDSPSWAIRNAATQLISTLVMRIFGQKGKGEQSSHQNFEEFATLYPDLVNFICDKLRMFMTKQKVIRPSLYLVLTMLSELTMCPLHHQLASNRIFLQSAVQFFLCSPVHSLRKLSAQAYVALSPLDCADDTMASLLRKLQEKPKEANYVHGLLLCAEFLLTSCTVSPKKTQEVLTFITQNGCWLLEDFPDCFLLTAALLRVARVALEMSAPVDVLLEPLWDFVQSVTLFAHQVPNSLRVGETVCLKECVHTAVAICQHSESNKEHWESQLVPFLFKSLASFPGDFCEAVLGYLSIAQGNNWSKHPLIQKALIGIISNPLTNMSNFTAAADALIRLSLKSPHQIQSPELLTINVDMLRKQRGLLSGVQAALFSVESLVIGHAELNSFQTRVKSVHAWSRLLVTYSHPSANESQRLLAGQALYLAGEKVFGFCSTNRDMPHVVDTLINLISSVLSLLEDSEKEVRMEVASFLAAVTGTTSLHSNLGYAVLSDIVSKQMYWCHDLLKFILGLVYAPGQLTDAISAALKTSLQPLFEPETVSALAEPFIQQTWAYQTISVVMRGISNCSFFPVLQSFTDLALMELSSNLPLIKGKLKDKPIFNLSSHQKVAPIITGLQLLLQLHTNTASSSTIPQDSNMSVAAALLEISGLQPYWTDTFVHGLSVMCQLVQNDDDFS